MFLVILLLWKSQNTRLQLKMCRKKNEANRYGFCLGENSSKCVPPFQSGVYHRVYKVADAYRLLGCTIEKNFSTALVAIICYLYNETAFIINNRVISEEYYQNRFCKYLNEYSSLSEIESKFNSSLEDWTMIAVLRDPLERFVSGFTDKCLREMVWRYYPKRCLGCYTNLTCFMEKLYDKMMKMTNTNFTGDFIAHHFFPQSWRCQFHMHYHSYQILKFSTFNPAEFISDLTTTLLLLDIPGSSIGYIDRSISSTRTVHTTRGTAEQENTKRKILSDSYLMDLFIRMFYYDFVLFGFPFPDASE
ncbi:unnamed protein product [Cylicocyclus nassatus]|uniref:Sulfotransferase n=1 Tax=Cylicocyclus nassatus TaxID=53992 RepID=A0AA36DJG4_CYLNA|nr:unnamed protein product [Cylicocyclus nassatus]